MADLESGLCPDLQNDPVQSKWLACFSPKEQRAVCELYNKLSDLTSDESLKPHMMVDTLIRYVHSKDLKVSAAEKEIRAYYAWRKSYKVDEKVAAWETSQARTIFEKYTTRSTFGTDKNGMPVYYNPMGLSDPDAICDLIGPHNWLLAHIWEVETQYQLARKLGAEKGICIYKWALVIDVTGFECGRAMRAIDAYSDTAKILDKNYPDRATKVLLINAPWVFTAVFKIAKGIMSDETVASLGAYGEKPKEWLKDMLVYVDSDQIPVKLGGTAPGPGVDWYLTMPPQKIDKNDTIDEVLAAKKS